MLDFFTCHPRQHGGIVLRKVGEEVMLYNPETRKAHVLNTTSHFIWELCTGKNSLETIERELRSRFAVPSHEDVRGDIVETVTAFSREGLVQL
jgi:hypothetical protein